MSREISFKQYMDDEGNLLPLFASALQSIGLPLNESVPFCLIDHSPGQEYAGYMPFCSGLEDMKNPDINLCRLAPFISLMIDDIKKEDFLIEPITSLDNLIIGLPNNDTAKMRTRWMIVPLLPGQTVQEAFKYCMIKPVILKYGYRDGLKVSWLPKSNFDYSSYIEYSGLGELETLKKKYLKSKILGLVAGSDNKPFLEKRQFKMVPFEPAGKPYEDEQFTFIKSDLNHQSRSTVITPKQLSQRLSLRRNHPVIFSREMRITKLLADFSNDKLLSEPKRSYPDKHTSQLMDVAQHFTEVYNNSPHHKLMRKNPNIKKQTLKDLGKHLDKPLNDRIAIIDVPGFNQLGVIAHPQGPGLPKNSIIDWYAGDITDDTNSSENDQNLSHGFRLVSDWCPYGHNLSVDAGFRTNIIDLINTSNPSQSNIHTKLLIIKKIPVIIYQTLRHIKPGEALYTTYDSKKAILKFKIENRLTFDHKHQIAPSKTIKARYNEHSKSGSTLFRSALTKIKTKQTPQAKILLKKSRGELKAARALLHLAKDRPNSCFFKTTKGVQKNYALCSYTLADVYLRAHDIENKEKYLAKAKMLLKTCITILEKIQLEEKWLIKARAKLDTTKMLAPALEY